MYKVNKELGFLLIECGGKSWLCSRLLDAGADKWFTD